MFLTNELGGNREQKIREFMQQKPNRKTKVISFINLKGGVAKTTTTVGTAECLAAQGHKVLVIDLDPQTNATIMLIGEEKWSKANRNNLTLATLFDDACNGTRRFDLKETVQIASVCAREANGRVFILPSSLDLIAKQDELARLMSGRFGAQNPVEVLQKALAPIRRI